MEELSWTALATRVPYQGRVTLVEHTVRLPDGGETTYEVDESIPFAVATLVTDGDDLLLTRQYRYPLRRWIYDLPGGAGSATETPSDAARRELEEELGVIATVLEPLHTFSANPGRTAWPVHFFSRGTLRSGSADTTDPSEQVQLARMGVAELDALIAQGEIVDPSLIIARACAAASGLLPPLGA